MADDTVTSDNPESPPAPAPMRPPESSISRLTPDTQGKSATLCEPLLGYISLQILYLGVPVKGLPVKVTNADGEVQQSLPRHRAAMGWKDAALMVTNDDGYCTLGKKVLIGSYTCHIEHQFADAAITTVEAPDRPFILTLPFGRPYSDLYVEPED